jgi:hypothetical protein
MQRIELLLNVHHSFCNAAGLPEGSRPYGAQSRLDDIQKLIMEEIKKEPTTAPTTPTTTDDIPF